MIIKSKEYLTRLANAIAGYLYEAKLSEHTANEWAVQRPDPLLDIVTRSMNSGTLSDYEFAVAAVRIIPDISAVFGTEAAEAMVSGVKGRLDKIMDFPETAERASQVLRSWGLNESNTGESTDPLSLLDSIARSVHPLPRAIGDVLISETLGVATGDRFDFQIVSESGLGAENGRVKIGRGAVPGYRDIGSCTLLLKRGETRKFEVMWVSGDNRDILMTPSDISDTGYKKGDTVFVFFV